MDGACVCTIRMCLRPMNCKVVKIVNFMLCVFYYKRKKSLNFFFKAFSTWPGSHY